ncbi:MAG: cupin domain-containing protein [Myxococcota bacterium]|nr:cupin domain-containing protein [Myxococcota bacterium]
MKRPDDIDEFLAELGAEEDLDVAGALALLAGESEGSAALRERVIAAVRTTHRWDDLEAKIASLIDLDLDATRALLVAIDERGGWEAGIAESVELLHFRGGTAVADAITGFVRIAPGEAFPEHEHVGDESVLVLQGAFRDSSGTLHERGELVQRPAGSSHSLVAVGALPLVYLAIVQRGVRIAGELLTPDDPRA